MDAQMSSHMSSEFADAVVTDDAGNAHQPFSNEELATLEQLRASYEVVGDVFSSDEVARLRFVRWLYAAGRLEP
jgi:hypothetical protein